MNIQNLKRLYFGFIATLVILIIFTPLLINSSFFFLSEEPMEVLAIGFLFLIGFILNRLYEKELKLNKNYLQEAWSHIGEINLLTDAFTNALVNIEKYPESKKELKNFLATVCEKILNITNAPYVLLRILLSSQTQTLSEHFQARSGVTDFELKISNKQLLKNMLEKKYKVFSSAATNISIKVFCVFPENKISPEQEIFLQKIVNDLAMIYLIYDPKLLSSSQAQPQEKKPATQ
ncbi:MAG: hypothetical protein WCF93_02855 [Candidatus Moraniibacteriota bacterium]